MEVLVIGASGLLGSNVAEVSLSKGYETTGTYRDTDFQIPIPSHQLDVRNEDRVGMLIRDHRPDLVVNCAALTDVDACEREPEKAKVINGNAPGLIAAVCDDHEIPLIHISTDYVFPGASESHYTEEDVKDPIQEYGKTKLAGERNVQLTHDNPIIVRVSFLYGYNRSTESLEGFPAWVIDRLRLDENIPLFTDQYITPTACRTRSRDHPVSRRCRSDWNVSRCRQGLYHSKRVRYRCEETIGSTVKIDNQLVTNRCRAASGATTPYLFRCFKNRKHSRPSDAHTRRGYRRARNDYRQPIQE